MKQALVLAAGLGTRLKPLTNTMPKALVRVGGFALLEHNLLKLHREGFERVVVNVHHFGEQIIDFLEQNDGLGLDTVVSDERELLLDTGGGLRKAQQLLDAESPVLIHNVDILSDLPLSPLLEVSERLGAAVLAISERTSASGRYLLFDSAMRLVGWTNERTGEVRSPFEDALQRAAHRAPFAGIHAFHPTLFPLMQAWPERFGIIDFYLSICRNHAVYGHMASCRLIDVGKADSLAEAERFVAETLM